ncbi:hypothetical protein G6F57_006081 [Rhizopus arrhizus]|uniref:Secreted protein n=1 Tax=Rhizopus oryzae TaxID=64495 RepID=A0A9P6XA18_RHIOR|nr:hypothetical protein G6F30_001610 [Rhizopus arrhizus]KAG1416274.1 hypothetical protein G6F58_006062 [Rhizopus delemar]KAG0989661.1 hypothetical protein G6F29_000824 [Rhizopus arrhizus]KAG0993281.1 hypothetical protein G6F28_006845 [Rhizopus arrhizus]KAG1007194.1 hypothetical protein G6F27_007609 [Rhizopus arrhizus]
MVNTLALIASASFLSSFVNAYGMIAQVVDANNFCVFLPPANSKNRNIADTEWEGQAFCLGNTPKATKAGKLNSDFIQSAHYLATDKYVQVTGQMDPSKQKLNATDDGGQFDVKAPKGSSCAGWKYYVNLIEPVTKTYCMRCCNDDRTCNRGISEKGCFHIIPGDYTGPYGGVEDGYPNDGDANSGSSTSTTTTTKERKTTTTTKEHKTTTKEHKTTTTTHTTPSPTTTTTTQEVVPTTTITTEDVAPVTTTTTTTKEVVPTTTTTEAPKTTTISEFATTTTKPAALNPSPETSSKDSSNDSSNGPSKDSSNNPSTGSSKTSNIALSENEEASAQSVSGVASFKPATIITLSATLATIVFMMA